METGIANRFGRWAEASMELWQGRPLAAMILATTLAGYGCEGKGIGLGDTADIDDTDVDDTDTDTADTDTDTADTDTDTDDTGTEETDATIYEVQQGVYAEGETITLRGVTVISDVTGYGFFVAEPTGGAQSGLWVYYGGNTDGLFDTGAPIVDTGSDDTGSDDTGSDDTGAASADSGTGTDSDEPDTDGSRAPTVDTAGSPTPGSDTGDTGDTGAPTIELGIARGDQITITGRVAEYSNWSDEDSVTELVLDDPADLSVTGAGEAPEPTVLTVEELNDPETAELYEGCLVTVEDVSVSEPDDDFGEWILDDTVQVGTLFYSPHVYELDTFESVSGPLHYHYGMFKLEPRDENDLVGQEHHCSAEICGMEIAEGQIIITELMMNPESVGLNSDNEWIEVYNTTSSSVNLNGTWLLDDAETKGKVRVDVVMASETYAILGISNGSTWNYPTIGVDAHWGSGMQLTNDGEQVHLMNEVGTIDSTPYFTSSKPDTSWSLDPASFDSTSNNNIGNWCYGQTAFGNSEDGWGTPNAENEDCDPDTGGDSGL